MVTPTTKSNEKKILHVAHKAGYDVVYYTNNYNNNDNKEEQEEQQRSPSPLALPLLSPQQQNLYKNIPHVPSPPPPFASRPSLSPKSATTANNNNSTKNNSSSISKNNNTKQQKKKKVISPPSHAFLFRQDNPHYYSPPTSDDASEGNTAAAPAAITTTSRRIATTTTTTTLPLTSTSSSCMPMATSTGAGFGTIRSPANAANTSIPLFRGPATTTATTTATGGTTCEEEEECNSPFSDTGRSNGGGGGAGGGGGGLIVPFARTRQEDDNVPISAASNSPLFGASSSSVSSLTAATSQHQHGAASSSSQMMLLLPPDQGDTSSQYSYENDINQANLPSMQVLGIATTSPAASITSSPPPPDTGLHKKRTTASAKTIMTSNKPKSKQQQAPPPRATAKSNRRASLDSTVAAATGLAVAAAAAVAANNNQQQANNDTPRNATTSTGTCSSIYTPGSGGGGQQEQQAPNSACNSRLSWPSLMLGHQEIQDYCYQPPGQHLDDDDNILNNTSNDNDDISSSKQQLLPANLIPSSNNTTSNDGLLLLLSSSEEEESGDSSFNEESSIMHGNEGDDGIMNVSHFESLRKNNKNNGSSCLGRNNNNNNKGNNGSGDGINTAANVSAGNNSNQRTRAISEWGRQYARRRRMQWMLFVGLALLTLLIITIVVPRTVTTAQRENSLESGVDDKDESVNNNDLAGGNSTSNDGSENSTTIPTLSPTAAALLNGIPGSDGPTTAINNTNSNGIAPTTSAPASLSAPATLLAPSSAPIMTLTPPPQPTTFPRARFQPSVEPTPQLVKDTPTMGPVDAANVVVGIPSLSPTISKVEGQNGQVKETGLSPIGHSRDVLQPSSQPTPQLIKDTPTTSPVEAGVVEPIVKPPTLSPVVSNDEETEQGQVVDETELTSIIDCFPDAATLPLDSSILQASLIAPSDDGSESTTTTASPNRRPTFPFCNVPPNPDWSSLIRFGPQEWFSINTAQLPALIEICMDETTRNDASTTNTTTGTNSNSDSPFALNDETIVANNLNFVRPFLVLFDKPQESTSCAEQEEDLSCQVVTEFVVPGNIADGSPISSGNNDVDMLANDMDDTEAEYCQSIYYPGLENVDEDASQLLLLAGVYGYSHRVDDILTVDFTISAKTNNVCRNAVPFHLAADKTTSGEALVIHGTTQGIDASIQDTELPPCGSTSESVPGVWYEIQGTGDMIRLNTCNSPVENIMTIFTTTMTDQSDSTDTVCEQLQCINDDEQSFYQEVACAPAATITGDTSTSTGGGGGNSVVFSTQINQVYFVRVHPKVDEASSSSSRALQSDPVIYEEVFPAAMGKKLPKGTKQPMSKKTPSKKKTDDDEVVVAQEQLETTIGGPFELMYQKDKAINDTDDLTENMVAAQSLDVCMQAKEIVLGTEQVHMYSWLSSQQNESRNNDLNVVQDFGLMTCTDQIAVTTAGAAKWFSFVGNGEEVYINTCSDLEDETLTDFQTILSVYLGESCNELACVDTTKNITLARTAGFRCSAINDSHISFITEQGKQYYVAVHGVNGDLGDFRLKFGHTSCLVLGVPMERPMRATGDVRVGLLANDPQPQKNLVVVNTAGDTVAIQSGRFFAYYGTGGIMIASTCNLVSDFEAQLSIYSGKCSSPVQIAHYESPISCGPGREVFWKSEAGQYYYIQVSSKEPQLPATSLGKFGLMVSAGGGDVCATAFGPVVPAVADDDQSDINYWALEGWTVSSLVDPISNCGAAASSPKVYGKWYKTTGTGSTMEWYTSFHDPNEGASISVFRGNCDNLECVDFDENDGKVVWKSHSGEVYYVLVASTTASSLQTAAAVQESTLFSVSVKQWNNVCEFTTEADFETLPTDGTVVYGRTMGWSEFTFSPPTPTITYVSNCAVNEIANDGRNAWYTVIGTNSTLTASACSRSIGTTSLDVIVLEERTLDSGCNDLVGVSSLQVIDDVVVANTVNGSDTTCSVSWHAEAGRLYRLVLRASQQTDRGRYGISVTESITQQG